MLSFIATLAAFVIAQAALSRDAPAGMGDP